MKVAAIEAEWETQPAPASFTRFGFPDRGTQETRAAVRIPWALGLMATRSLDGVVPGIHEFVARNRQRIENGIAAHAALQAVRADRINILKQQAFQTLADDLGYGLLTLRYVDDPAKARVAARRVGKECGKTVRSRWSPEHRKKKKYPSN